MHLSTGTVILIVVIVLIILLLIAGVRCQVVKDNVVDRRRGDRRSFSHSKSSESYSDLASYIPASLCESDSSSSHSSSSSSSDPSCSSSSSRRSHSHSHSHSRG